MIITVNAEKKEASDDATLDRILLDFTPYGEEATIIVHNGTYYKSIDEHLHDVRVQEGDDISIVPLIIGG